ncbi:hypothetical protein KR084_008938 [Drosophila pseudotakahashii]|nr:hypothetical protein KR084_008938 [Drosophila pseudotakahashii]
MSLEGARLRYEDENGETVVLAAKGRTFQVGSYFNCDLLLEQEERLICEINCDAFGRVTIYNKSNEDLIHLNDVVIHGKRPLLHGGKITIRGKVYTWEFPKSSADDPCTPERLSHNEQAPNSCPSMKQSHRPQLEKRLTVHNFHYSINSDDEGNTSIESRDLSQSHLEEEDSLNISTPPSAEATTCESPKVNLLESTQNKENTATPPGSHKKLLKLCALSDVVITSFSPRETGVKVEKSFTCVRKPANAASTSASVTVSTPKSVYSTPKGGVLSELNEDSCSRDLMDFGTPSTSTKAKRASSMFLIDLTTPSKLRPTPKQAPTPKQTPISVDSTDESSDASPLVIDITNSATPPSPGPSQRYKTPKRPAGNTGATPKRTPQSLMKRALLTSTKKQIAANQTDKTTPVATAKRPSLLEARRQCLSTPRRLPFHPHRRTPIQRPEEHARGKVPKTSPRRRISLMDSPRENKVSQLQKSFAAAKRSPGVDKSNKLVAKARRSLNSPKSGSPLPGSPKPSSPCPRKTFNVSQIKSSTPEKLDDSKDELSRTFTIMDDTKGEERSAAGAVIEAVAALITGEVEGDVSFQLDSVFKTSPSLTKSKQPILIQHKVESISPPTEKEVDLNSAEEKMNSTSDDAIFIVNEAKLDLCAENDLKTVKDEEKTKIPSSTSLQDKEKHETLSIPVDEKGEEPIDDSICEEVHANIPKGSDIAYPESIIEDNICEEVPSDSKTSGESILIGETKQKMNEQTPNVNTPVLRRSSRRLSVDQKTVATTPRRSTRRSSMEASNKQVFNENNKRSRRASCSAVNSQTDVGTPQRKRRLTQEMSTPTRQSKRLLNTPKRELPVDESVGDMGVILEEAGQEDEEKSAIADDENYGNELPADEVDKIDYHGLRDLLKTPKNCSTPRFKGLREMMRTPKIPASPILSNMAELLETSVGSTPHHKSRSTTVARVEQGKPLDGILKTPSARNIMVPNEPASAVLKSRVDSLAATTEYDLNMTNTTLHLDKIFDDVPETSGANMEDTETEINVTALSTATSADPLGCSKLNESVSSEALISVCHKGTAVASLKDPLTSTTYKAALQADLNLSGFTDTGSRTTSPNPNEMSGIQLLDQTSDSMFSEALMVSAVDSCDVTVDETKASGQTIQPTDNTEDRSDTDSNVGLTEPLVFSDDEEEPEESEVTPKKSTDFEEPSIAYKLEESADLPENKSVKEISSRNDNEKDSISEISLIEVEDTTIEGSISEANLEGDKIQDEKSLDIKLDISKEEKSSSEENDEPPVADITIIESEIFPLDSTADSSVNTSNVLNYREEKILPKVDPKPDNLESTNLDDVESTEVSVEKALDEGVARLDKSVINTSPAEKRDLEKTTEAETNQPPIEASPSNEESTEIKSDVVSTAQSDMKVPTVAESDQPVIAATLSEELFVESKADEVHLPKVTNPNEHIENETTQPVIETSTAETVTEKDQTEGEPTDAEFNQIAIKASPFKHRSEENKPDEVPCHGETDQEVIQTFPAEEIPEEVKPDPLPTDTESEQPVIETSPSEQLTEENKPSEVPTDGQTEQKVINASSAEELSEEVKPDEVSTDAESNQPVIVTSGPEQLSTEKNPDADDVPTDGETDQEVIKADPSQELSEESKPDEVEMETSPAEQLSEENKLDGETDQNVIETSPAKDLSEETKLNEPIDKKPNQAVIETSPAEKLGEDARTQTDSKSKEPVIETSPSIQQEVIEATSLQELSEEVRLDEVVTDAESNQPDIGTSSPKQLSKENKPDADEVPTDGKTDEEVIETSPAKELLKEAKPDDSANQAVRETSPAAKTSKEANLDDVPTGNEADKLAIETSPDNADADVVSTDGKTDQEDIETSPAKELSEEAKPDETTNQTVSETSPAAKTSKEVNLHHVPTGNEADELVIETSPAEALPEETKPDLKKNNDAPTDDKPSQANESLSSESPNINQNVAQDKSENFEMEDNIAFDEENENSFLEESSKEVNQNGDVASLVVPTPQIQQQVTDQNKELYILEESGGTDQTKEDVAVCSEKTVECQPIKSSEQEIDNEVIQLDASSIVHENTLDESSATDHFKEDSILDKTREGMTADKKEASHCRDESSFVEVGETDQPKESSGFEETKEDKELDKNETEKYNHIEPDDEVIQLDASSIVEESPLDESLLIEDSIGDSIQEESVKQAKDMLEEKSEKCVSEESFNQNGVEDEPEVQTKVQEVVKEDISKKSSDAKEPDLGNSTKTLPGSQHLSSDEYQMAVQNQSIIDLDASNDGKGEEDVEFVSEQVKMVVPSAEEKTKLGDQPTKVAVIEQYDVIDLDDSSSSAQGTETTDAEATSVISIEEQESVAEKESVVTSTSVSKEPQTSIELVKEDTVKPESGEESIIAFKSSDEAVLNNIQEPESIQEIQYKPTPKDESTQENPDLAQDLSSSTGDAKQSKNHSEENPSEESAHNTSTGKIYLENPISETNSSLESTKMPSKPSNHEENKSPLEGLSTPVKRVTRKGSASSDRPAEAGVSERPKRLARKPSADVSNIEERAMDNKQADEAHVKLKGRARKPSADVDDDKQEAITERRRGRKRTPSVEVPETTTQNQLKVIDDVPKPEEALQPILEEEPVPAVEEEKDSKAEQDSNQREVTVEKPKRRGRKASAKETEATLETEETTKDALESVNEDKSDPSDIPEQRKPEEPVSAVSSTKAKEESKSEVQEKQEDAIQKETDTMLDNKEKAEDVYDAVNEQEPFEESHTSSKVNEKKVESKAEKNTDQKETMMEKPKRRGRNGKAKETEITSDKEENPADILTAVNKDETPHSNPDNADHSQEEAPQDALHVCKEEQEITSETETSAQPAKSKRPKRRGRKPSAEVVESTTSNSQQNEAEKSTAQEALSTVQEGESKSDDQNMPQPRPRRSAEFIPASVQEPAKNDHIEKPKRRGRKPSVDIDHVAKEVTEKPRRRGRTPAGEEKREPPLEEKQGPPLQDVEPEKKTRRNARQASAETVEAVMASEDAHLQQIEEAAEPVSESETSPIKAPPKEDEEHKTRRRGRKPTAETIEFPIKTNSPENSDEIPSHSRRRGRKATEDEVPSTVDLAEPKTKIRGRRASIEQEEESQPEVVEQPTAKTTRRGRKPSADVEATQAAAPEKKPPTRRVRKASASVDEATPVAKKAATRRGRKEETHEDDENKQIDLQDLPTASVSALVITSGSPTKAGDVEELTPRRREGRNLPRKNYEEAPDDDKPHSGLRRARKPAASKALTNKALEPESLTATPVAKPPPVEVEATPDNTVVMPEPTTSQRREGRNLPRKNYTEAPDDDKPTSSRGRRVRNLTAKALELIVDSSPRPATPKRPKGKAVEDEEPPAKKATPEVPSASETTAPEDEPAPAAKGRATRRKAEHSESEESDVKPVRKNARAAARKVKVEVEPDEHPPVKRARGGARAKTPVEESAATAEGEPVKKPAARSRARGAKAAEPEPPAEDGQDQDAPSISAATGRGGRGRKVHFEAAPEVATSEDAPKRATRSRRK